MIAVRFLPDAEAELLHEVACYAKARSGAAIRFQAAVEASIGRAALHGTRRAVLQLLAGLVACS